MFLTLIKDLLYAWDWIWGFRYSTSVDAKKNKKTKNFEEVGTIIISIFQMEKLRPAEAK